MRFYLGTGNSNKVAEFSRLFREAGIKVEIRPATDVGGMPEVEETAETFADNALLKARALQNRLGSEDWVLADDSGLEVEALNGEPGIRSARYSGPWGTDASNRAKLLHHLDGLPEEKRKARFVCALALLGPDGIEEVFEGICSGRIARFEYGNDGFGYDSLFIPEGFDQTFAQVSGETKDKLSHRGDALRKLFDWIRTRSD